MTKPVISIIMGSKSDWVTMQKPLKSSTTSVSLTKRKLFPHTVHRTLMFKHAEEARSRGIKVIIAGAGGAAHLPGYGCC